MRIEELLQALPSKETLSSAVGIHPARRGYASGAASDLLPALGIFGTGMLLGAGLALLFAPKPGREMRADIAEKARELGGQARDTAEHAAAQGRQAANDLYGQAVRGEQSEPRIALAEDTVKESR